MGLFSMIFGAKEVEVTRPDFNNVISKAAHFSNGVSLTYDIPGNLSNMMGFASGYTEESPRTYDVNLDDPEGFSQARWRMSKDIDGAMWEYLGDKNKGLGGELGSLHFDLNLNRYSAGSLQDYVLSAYDDFLNGPDGPNTEIRESEMADGATDEELGDWIAYAPASIEKRMVGGTEFLFWLQSNEHRGREFVYYVLPLGEKHFASFTFNYSVKANNEQDLQEQSAMILEDIDTFMQRVAVSSKN